MPKQVLTNPQPGDVVRVFNDPVTQRDSQGRAELIEKMGFFDRKGHNYRLEYWAVKFLDDGKTYTRAIRVEDA